MRGMSQGSHDPSWHPALVRRKRELCSLFASSQLTRLLTDHPFSPLHLNASSSQMENVRKEEQLGFTYTDNPTPIE